jgi:hypothetical protein
MAFCEIARRKKTVIMEQKTESKPKPVCLSREKIARTGKKDSLKKSQTVVPVFK